MRNREQDEDGAAMGLLASDPIRPTPLTDTADRACRKNLEVGQDAAGELRCLAGSRTIQFVCGGNTGSRVLGSKVGATGRSFPVRSARLPAA